MCELELCCILKGYLPLVTMVGYSILLFSMVLLLLSSMGGCHNQDGCGRHKCGRHGPSIRFPFRLKDKEPPHCGYPGFDLTCNNNDTLFEISTVPVPIKFHVIRIEYEYNYFQVSDPGNCLPSQFLKLINTSIAPFLFGNDQKKLNDISFFNCSPDAQYQFSCPIYAAYDMETLLSSNLVSCTKMFDISSIFDDAEALQFNLLDFWWSKPNCSECETKGNQCKLKSNGTEGEVECFEGHHMPVYEVLLGATGETN